MPGLKLPKKREIKRYNKLFSILVKYGFEDVMSHSNIKKMIPASYLKKHPDTRKNIAYSTFERIRMVLEELGPTYVKFGQIFSNREDMLPPELILELEKLQDHVPQLQNFEVQKVIEQELNIKLENHFRSIDAEPIAAASLAQVHKGQLLNGDLVALKIQRPNIAATIEADIQVMKQIAGSLEKHSAKAKSLKPMLIVESFEKSITEELQFLREVKNMERFAQNFKGNEAIYIPKVQRELSTDRLICMEFIRSIKISETEQLKNVNIDCSAVGQVGVDLFLEQVLDHGFFHADPHPGNLFVLPDRDQICFFRLWNDGYPITQG